ncbi:MAG: DUF342 domain-containing protein [Spirochaetaceae bacterium]|nr:DUF342 domain-containing protein [Spirochaetaceae bacterium]
MVRLDKIQQKLHELYEEDANRFFVEASGASLEEAISSAAIQLGVKPQFVDYEIVERGKSGFFTINPRDWKIIGYKTKNADLIIASQETGEQILSEAVEASKNNTVDGQAFICCLETGIYLKVVAPEGNGRKIKIDDVIEKFKVRSLPLPPETVLLPIIKEANSEYHRVAKYMRVAANDATITVNISDDEMSAYLYVLPPGPGGTDVTVEKIEFFLKNNRVVYGFDEQRAKDFQDMPIYKTEYLIASGKKAQNGNDAYMKYNFEVDRTRIRLQESQSGQIDFKELNLIQNVVAGQPIAQKIPAERGVPGTSVTGRYIEASNGKDISIPLGKNTRLADDGLTVLAEINGHVMINKGKIIVDPVFIVEGNVSLKTGNIEFLGSVFITGNVDDTFSVKASGNIEVKGTVGKCDLDAEGDIIISQGVIGKEGGTIRTSKSIWAKFIQNEKLVDAGENVVVSDGILNSVVMAKQKIVCNGKRADIIGGVLSASEMIVARNIGSPTAGNDTVLNVGFDPKTKDRLTYLLNFVENNQKMLNEINLNLKVLEEQKKRRGGLQGEKEEAYEKYQTTKYTLETEIAESQTEIESLKEYLNTIKTEGKVSASGNVFAGVTINIKDFTEVVRVDCKATTFYLDKGLVRYGKYEKIAPIGGPSGYSTN